MISAKSHHPGSTAFRAWVGLAAALIALAGCQQTAPLASAPAPSSGQPGKDQQVFDTYEQAVQAVLTAAKTHDKEAMRHLFGPLEQELLSGDPVEDNKAFDSFSMHAAEQLHVDKQADGKYILVIGKKDWPFPIPLVKASNNKWFFDTAAGKEEILARRIGRNELDTIKTCRLYVLAQRQYAGKDRDDSGVFKYAQRLRSRPGMKDGLYWEAAPGEEQSPFGPLIAEAALKGYALDQKGAARQNPYHGYLFHILTRQGPSAPGGRYDYVINGNMIAGFALVASPAKYGSSGIMTFIINHQGRLYQKDLGPDTSRIVDKMTEFNPDSTWTKVKD